MLALGNLDVPANVYCSQLNSKYELPTFRQRLLKLITHPTVSSRNTDPVVNASNRTDCGAIPFVSGELLNVGVELSGFLCHCIGEL